MRMLARIGFAWVKWRSRRGLCDASTATAEDWKQESRRVGVRGETYAYWYPRRHGYVFIAKNYEPARKRANWIWWDLTATRWHLWKCEPVLRAKPYCASGIEHRKREARGAGADSTRIFA